MPDRTEAELIQRSDDGDTFAVFLYTPLCGTCKVAERMLDVAAAMRPRHAPLRANLNAMPRLAARWRIESVPCLVHVRGGAISRKLYAFASVENVVRFLESVDSGTEGKEGSP
ncbi:thioredoxin family protein [Paenibacillus sp. GYB003]|uniref:thioredoxin family protein n=1 Tax=Paenibacillus sp. GYB003 TaxID=2994392 RepID=UPI002F9655CB